MAESEGAQHETLFLHSSLYTINGAAIQWHSNSIGHRSSLELELAQATVFRVSSESFDYSGSFKFVPSLSIQVERLKVSQKRKSEQTSANQIQLHSVYMDARKLKIESKKVAKSLTQSF